MPHAHASRDKIVAAARLTDQVYSTLSRVTAMAASEGDFSSSEPSCIATSDQLSRATLAGGPKKPEIPAWPKSEIRVGDDYQVCCRLGALMVL